MLDQIDRLHRVKIAGTTDSEIVFRYLMSPFLRHRELGLLNSVRRGHEQVLT